MTILARSGAQVREVADRQVTALRSTRADVVLVSAGANDVTHLTRVGTFRDRYRELVDGIRSARPDADVILIGIPDIGTAPRLLPPLRQLAGWRGDRLDDEIAGIAADAGLLHVDLAGRTGARFADEPDRLFSADRYHPDADGHAVWAEAVLEAIEVSGLAGSLGS
jgi:lysophospholipase L1-like esterase